MPYIKKSRKKPYKNIHLVKMYRLCITYTENNSVKNEYSLWYVSKEEAERQGKKNFSGLYAEKCLEQGLAKMVLETKKKQ